VGKPDHREQQRDTSHHRERQAAQARLVLQRSRKALDQNRDEDQVIDAEDDLEQSECEKSQPDVRIGEQRGAPLATAGDRALPS
jgi:hypothetical protein